MLNISPIELTLLKNRGIRGYERMSKNKSLRILKASKEIKK